MHVATKEIMLLIRNVFVEIHPLARVMNYLIVSLIKLIYGENFLSVIGLKAY